MLFLVIIPRKFLSDFSLKFTGRFDPMSMETERFMEEQRKFNPKPTRKQFEESPGWTWGKVAKGVGESVLVVGWFIYLCLFDSERFGVRRMFISLCYLSFRRGKQLYTPKKMAAKWWKFCKIHSVFGRSWRFGLGIFQIALDSDNIQSKSTTSHEPFFWGGRVMACSEFLITTSCSEKDLQYLCPHHDCNHLNEPSSKWCQFFFENENDKLQLCTL